MSDVLRNQLLAAFDWTDKAVEDLFAAIPVDQFLHQPCPGANHALWTLGHLATVNQYFLKTLAGRDGALFEKYKAMFFAKSQPSPDAATYPPIDVLRDYFQSSQSRISQLGRSRFPTSSWRDLRRKNLRNSRRPSATY